MIYTLAKFLIGIAARIFYRMKFSGAENIPKDGAFILCSNHIHSFDPAMLVIGTKRRFRFMAKKELFEKPFGRSLLSALGAFPVDRGSADLSSYRNALKLLKNGDALLMFSQGTRMKELNLKDAKGGVALFCVKAKVPVVPAAVSGDYRFNKPLEVRFGAPIYLDDYYDMRLSTDAIDEIMAKIVAEIDTLLKKISTGYKV